MVWNFEEGENCIFLRSQLHKSWDFNFVWKEEDYDYEVDFEFCEKCGGGILYFCECDEDDE